MSPESAIVPDAAFVYNQPWPLARKLVGDRMAFWKAVEVRKD